MNSPQQGTIFSPVFADAPERVGAFGANRGKSPERLQNKGLAGKESSGRSLVLAENRGKNNIPGEKGEIMNFVQKIMKKL